MAWIQTHLGSRINPFSIDPNKVRIGDIAHSLAHQCRFYGHTKKFYSVAEHSILVARSCKRENRLWGLMHDAAEAYLSDISAPIKGDIYVKNSNGDFVSFEDVERKAMSAITEAFSMRTETPEEVKVMDLRILAMEREHVMDCQRSNWNLQAEPVNEKPMFIDPETAKSMFLTEFFKYEGIERQLQQEQLK